MKVWIYSALVLTFSINLFAAETNSVAPLKIGANQATNYYDQQMTVTGMVAQVSIRPKIVFLNLDQPYPDSPFTLVIRPDATNQFGDIKALKGKNVEATGKIQNYHDRPEMVLEKTNQLTVVKVP